MRKFLFAASAAAILAAGSASAMPGASSNGLAVASPVENVALCFYIDGWNGPGMYECGFRWKRGHGWHGKRHDGHHDHHDKHHDKHHGDHH